MHRKTLNEYKVSSAQGTVLCVLLFHHFDNCRTGSNQGLTENFFKFAEFTLTIEDAQEYVYSISPTKRVRGWRDIEIKRYI